MVRMTDQHRGRYDPGTQGSTPTRSWYTSPAVSAGLVVLVPVGTQWKPARSVVLADCEHLVDLRTRGFEVQRRRRHVQAPNARPPGSDLRDGSGPHRFEIAHPGPQRECVVLAQALDVPGLEIGALHPRAHAPDFVQLAVGEHITVDEAAPRESRPLAGRPGPGDAVVQHAAARAYQPAQRREVLVELRRAHVFEHSDRADRVEGSVAHVAVILHPDLDPILQSGLSNCAPGPLGLALREGHADGAHAMVLRGVDDHAAPAATDIEQAHARLGAELAAHELVLRPFRVLQPSS